MWRNRLVTALGDVAQPEAPPADMWAAHFLRAAALATAAMLTLACSNNGVAARDGGSDAVEAGAACDADCTGNQTCSLGRCISRACAAVEVERTGLLGCVFYTAQMENVDSDAEQPNSLLVTNPGNDTAMVALQFAQPASDGAMWVTLSGAQVERTSSRRFSVTGRAVRGAGLFSTAGLRLVSDRPVTVASIESDDRVQGEVSSSGGTMVWPLQSLGGSHRVMTYPQLATPAVAAVNGGQGGVGRITVVATGDTKLKIAPTTSALVLATGGQAWIPGDPIPMRDGDVLQILSDGDGSDLSGTEIGADVPVAVFSGNLTTSYGRTAPGINSPDMTYEQMPPLEAWNRRYVAAALPPQAQTCDSVLGGAGASLWRIVAAYADTVVSFSAPAGLLGVPSALTMAVGEVQELIVTGGSFTVIATKPVLVTQGIDCEPSLSLAISADQFIDDLRFATLPNFDQVVAVARVAGQSVALDDVVLDGGLFQPAGGGFEVALIPLPTCPSAVGVCTHRLRGKVGVTLRGMDVYGSWALTVPSWKSCKNPDGCP